MSRAASSRWERIRSQRLQNPTDRERYERTRRSLAAAQQVIELLDERRREAGLSKAELARRVGANPAAMRRLLTSGSGNPTLKTLFDVMDVLGIEMDLRTCVPEPTGVEHGSRKQNNGSLPARHAPHVG